MANYAWSPILTATKDGVQQTIKVGATVKPDDVGGKEHFDELVELGAIRDKKYPDADSMESPREFNLRKLDEAMAEAAESAYADLDFNISAPEEPAETNASSES